MHDQVVVNEHGRVQASWVNHLIVKWGFRDPEKGRNHLAASGQNCSFIYSAKQKCCSTCQRSRHAASVMSECNFPGKDCIIMRSVSFLCTCESKLQGNFNVRLTCNNVFKMAKHTQQPWLFFSNVSKHVTKTFVCTEENSSDMQIYKEPHKAQNQISACAKIKVFMHIMSFALAFCAFDLQLQWGYWNVVFLMVWVVYC